MREDGPSAIHRARLTEREALLFEAGIKLGGVFHQYLGTPVDSRTASGLAHTIESAVALQPYVERARVTIRPPKRRRTDTGRFDYHYLKPEMIRVTLWLRSGSTEVRARLEFRHDLEYPLMSVLAVRRVPARTRRPRSA
jgi:dihydroneopterin aldolase